MPIIILNITNPDGELLGRVELTADDLAHPAMIGRLVLAELPLAVRSRCHEVDATPEVSPAEFVREFGPSLS